MNFKDLVTKARENHAYCEGTDAFMKGYNHKMLVSPYEVGSKADAEWMDGFQDAYFIYNGRFINA